MESKEKILGFEVVLNKEEDTFIAEVPALRGCFSQGKTVEEAMENIKEAITCHLKSIEKHRQNPLNNIGLIH